MLAIVYDIVPCLSVIGVSGDCGKLEQLDDGLAGASAVSAT